MHPCASRARPITSTGEVVIGSRTAACRFRHVGPRARFNGRPGLPRRPCLGHRRDPGAEVARSPPICPGSTEVEAAVPAAPFNAEMLGRPNICSDDGPWAIIGGDFTTGYLEQDRLIGSKLHKIHSSPKAQGRSRRLFVQRGSSSPGGPSGRANPGTQPRSERSTQ